MTQLSRLIFVRRKDFCLSEGLKVWKVCVCVCVCSPILIVSFRVSLWKIYILVNSNLSLVIRSMTSVEHVTRGSCFHQCYCEQQWNEFRLVSNEEKLCDTEMVVSWTSSEFRQNSETTTRFHLTEEFIELIQTTLYKNKIKYEGQYISGVWSVWVCVWM